MKPRCAAYARYSSDRQSPSSIQDQLRKCREFADQQSWEYLEAHVYADEALSGAGSDRPAFLRLISAASQRPRPFDVLLVDDTSRISRNLGETARFYEQLSFSGVRVMALSQGIDSQSEQADVLLSVHGLVDSLYIKELAKKTHRGLEGRALLGLCTGGRCFGYDNVTEDGQVRQRINPSEAVIVQRIFELAADGGSLKAIAKKLNDESVQSPRPRAGKRYATWCPTAIRAMLRRELYTGRIVWNRSRFVKAPGSNKRLRRERPMNEWRIVERPELRIIDETLWMRVQKRAERIAEQFKGKRPGLYSRAATSPYLLTGFLRCGSCGANLAVVTGRKKDGHGKYGCPQNFYRGACPNKLKESADVVEKRLLSGLQHSVLQPEVVNYALQEFERQLGASLSEFSTSMERMRQRRDAIQQELDRLICAVASVGHSPALVKAINSREEELNEITRKLFTSEPDSVSAHMSRIRQFVYERLGNIRELLYTDVPRAKAELAKHVTCIEMAPLQDGKQGHYVAIGEWNLLGGLEGNLNECETERVRMVAGDGFEPSTFGL
jgi:DNA invertase Pin-like site-specific DNA recombinase